MSSGTWTTRGFDDFRRGRFGNAGHNLYVSRAGILQRIHQFDLNRNGYFDLVFSNSQSHLEMAPIGVYRDPLGTADYLELPGDGAWSGAVLDLNGNGYDDLVLGNWNNGIGPYMNAFIYYGSPEGWSERAHQRLPAPRCTSVADGDFNGDGRPDLAFLTENQVRLFYQTDLGFEPKRYTDTKIYGEQLGACDLDGDGYSDLVVRQSDGSVLIHWGSSKGINAGSYSPVPVELDGEESDGITAADRSTAEYIQDAKPLVQFVHLNELPHIFVARNNRTELVPVYPDRSFGTSTIFKCEQALAVAQGDINGNDMLDLVFACREPRDEAESSWIYWGNDQGYNEENKIPLKSYRACDVVLGDLDGDGCDEVILCQGHTPDWFTHEGLIYHGGAEANFKHPIRLKSHDARRVFLAHSSHGNLPEIVFVNTRARNKTEAVDVSIYFGTANGYSPDRRQDLPGWGAIGALCCDFNDNGHVDIVLVNSSHNTPSRDPGSYVYLNGPHGFSDEPTWRLPTRLAHGGCCADLNRDGYLDLVFAGHTSPEILIFHGTADGFDTDHPERILMTCEDTHCAGPLWIYLADLNNNGWLDLVVPQSRGDRSFILWGGPEGFSMKRSQCLSIWKGVCARAADLTGNGYLDLLVGGGPPSVDAPDDSFLYIYWNGPDGLCESRRTLLPANDVLSIAVADFDNDGLLDLFVPCYRNSRTRDIESYIYWNRPERGFSATDFTRLFTHSASGCIAADFNANGWIDLAIANHKVEGDHVGWSAVWWNGPDGFSENRQTRLPTAGPHGMICVDPGNIVDRGHEEYYISEAFQLPPGSRPLSVQWEGQIPPKTWVKTELRHAPNREALETTPWMSVPKNGEGRASSERLPTTALRGGWIQYRLALGAFNSLSSPRVSEVTVTYA